MEEEEEPELVSRFLAARPERSTKPHKPKPFPLRVFRGSFFPAAEVLDIFSRRYALVLVVLQHRQNISRRIFEPRDRGTALAVNSLPIRFYFAFILLKAHAFLP